MSNPKGQRPLPDQSLGPDATHLDEKVFCFYCGEPMARWGMLFSVDHVTPRSRGGPDAPGNRVPSCTTCNRAKSNKHWSEFAKELPPARQQMVSIALKDHDKQFPFAGRSPKPVPKKQKPRMEAIPPKDNEHLGAAAKSMAENILAQAGEPRGKDVAWFKARMSDVRELFRRGELFEAVLLLDAVASLPASFRPGVHPELAAEEIERRKERERPFRERFFAEDGVPHVIGRRVA